MGGGKGRKQCGMWTRRVSAFSCTVSDFMTSGICFKIIEEKGNGCGCGWGRIGHGLMVVGLCDRCSGFIIFLCLFCVCVQNSP